MAETPFHRKQNDAPVLIESPESIVGGAEFSQGAVVDGESSSTSNHSSSHASLEDPVPANEKYKDRMLYISNMLRDAAVALGHQYGDAYHKIGVFLATIKVVLQHWYEQCRNEVDRIAKSKEERQRYQIGGIVLAYALFMYLCTWTVTTPAPLATCPTYNDTLAWQKDAFSDECLAIHLSEGVPVTFLQSNDNKNRKSGRGWRMPSLWSSNDKTKDPIAAADSSAVTTESNARWVSLRYGRRRMFNPFLALWRFILRRLSRPSHRRDAKILQELENHPYPHAFTHEPLLSDEDMDFLEAWSDRLTDDNPDWHRRIAKVAWGGRSKWWHPHYARSSYYPLETIDGANLLYPYYQAMQQTHMQWDAGSVHFPRRQCASGCDTQVAILSTLEWRESYIPWKPSRDMMVRENSDGWVYARGLSKPSPHGRHGLVWLRVGQHAVQNSTSYTRAIVHSVDKGIAAALREGRVGRVNVIVDASDYEWNKIPDFYDIKQIFGIFEDHYPGRLGAVFLCNMSPAAEILFSLLKPLMERAVFDKIYILPQDPTERNEQLETVIAPEDIPYWLGGKDRFEFDTSYYNADFNPLDILPSME